MEADQCEVVVPKMADAVERAVYHFLDRRDRIQHPNANKAGINSAARLKRDEASVDNQRHTEYDPDGSLGSLNRPAHKLDIAIFPGTRALARVQPQLMAIFLNKSKSLSIFPVPSTTHDSGFSARVTGKPVSSRIRLSRFLISAPPPARTIPRSAISAESSGGVRSKTTRMELMMMLMHSSSASRISSSETITLFGTPSMRSRPLISIVRGWSSGYAEPISILICSAVRSPIRRLYLRLMYWVMASSISLPATLSERL